MLDSGSIEEALGENDRAEALYRESLQIWKRTVGDAHPDVALAMASLGVLALERGELEGNCGSWTAMPQEWLVNRKINALLRFSATRPVDMPADVPYVLDLATSQEQKDVIDILNSPGELGRPFIVAKQVPSERVAILRTALQATLKDEAFLADARKQSLLLDPVAGEEAEKIMAQIYAAPPDLIRKPKDVLE